MSKWKNFEKRAATLFGGIRCAFSGAVPSVTGTRSDVRHPHLYIEAKYRKSHWLANVWTDAKRKADREHKVPVVALAVPDKPGCWICIHSDDLDRLARIGRTDDLPLFAGME